MSTTLDKRKGHVGYVCVLKDVHSKEVEYIPASDIILCDNYTVQNLIEEFKALKEEVQNLNASVEKTNKNVLSLVALTKLSNAQINALKEEI